MCEDARALARMQGAREILRRSEFGHFAFRRCETGHFAFRRCETGHFAFRTPDTPPPDTLRESVWRRGYSTATYDSVVVE